MTTEEVNVEKKKKNKKSKKSKTISFDEEVVTKDAAEKILANVKIEEKIKSKKNKKRNKKKANNTEKSEDVTQESQSKYINESNVSESMEVDEEAEPPKKKKRNQLVAQSEQIEGDSENPTKDKKTESIRSIKRKRYAKLLEDKKQKTEIQLQEKGLNYLSKWKHSRNEWKFEKLRQIWLQTNMYDNSKIPDEFWETVVQYFSNSKGKSRDTLLKEALKIVESQESSEESTEISDKAQRARDIIQNLQE